MAYEPTDRELEEYIAQRLGHIDDHDVDPQFIAEVIAESRDLWVLLFQVDHDPDSIDLNDPRFTNRPTS